MEGGLRAEWRYGGPLMELCALMRRGLDVAGCGRVCCSGRWAFFRGRGVVWNSGRMKGIPFIRRPCACALCPAGPQSGPPSFKRPQVSTD